MGDCPARARSSQAGPARRGRFIARRLLKKAQVQGARTLRTEAYEQYAAGTKGEAQRSRWAYFSSLLAEEEG